MDMVFLIVSGVLAAMALYLLGDFALWRLRGHVVPAVITGFQSKKNKGLSLPVVSFTKEGGEAMEAKAQRIDRFIYLLERPNENNMTTIIYRTAEPGMVRVYGYMNVVIGMFLLAPLFLVLALQYGNSIMATKIIYFGAFGLVMIGALAFLKLIQRSY